MSGWILGLQSRQKERKGQKGDKCMHVNWVKEKEQEGEIQQAAILVFDSNRC